MRAISTYDSIDRSGWVICVAPDMLREGAATGAGFVYRSPDELRAAVHPLAGDIELWNRLGGHARQGYVRFYTEDKHLERYLGHIAAIIERKTGPAPNSCGRS